MGIPTICRWYFVRPLHTTESSSTLEPSAWSKCSISDGQTRAGDASSPPAAAIAVLIHHHAPVMSRGGVHPRHIRDSRASRGPLRILLDVVHDASMERHAAGRIEIGDGAGGGRRRSPHAPPAVSVVVTALLLSLGGSVPNCTAGIIQPVTILESYVRAVMVERKARRRRSPEGDAAY